MRTVEELKQLENRGDLVIIVTESNPNSLDRETGQPYLHNYVTKKWTSGVYYANLVINNYIDLYIETHEERPEDIKERKEWNDGKGFCFNREKLSLDWNNIRLITDVCDFSLLKNNQND